MAFAFVNARVLTMAQPGDEAEALLVDGPAIALVGSTAAVSAEARRRGAAVEDLGGRIVVPGFVDAHTHFLHVGVKRNRPDLRGCASLEEALEATASWLRARPGSSPVIAEGWDESGWPGRARPTRADVDGMLAAIGQPGRPVVLRRICGHVAVASSGAVGPVRARWGSDDLVDRATGVMLEQPSLYLNEVFPASAAELDGALEAACQHALTLGVTAVGDYSQAPYRAALQRAAAAGRLTVRVASSIYVQQLEAELAAGFRTGRPTPLGSPAGLDAPGRWLRDGGLKVFLDGSLGARTAALRGRYLDAAPGTPTECPDHRSAHGCVGHPHVRGTLNWGDGDVERLFRTAHAAGVQVHAHAIGDAAIDQGLDMFGKVLAEERGLGGGDQDWAGLSAGHAAGGFGAIGKAAEGLGEGGKAAGGLGAGYAAEGLGGGHAAEGLGESGKAATAIGAGGRAVGGPSGGVAAESSVRYDNGMGQAVPAGLGLPPDEGWRGLQGACRLRHRFEHYEIVHDEQVAAAVRLGIVASSQPNFVGTWSSKGGMYEERLGPSFHLNNRFQALRRAGQALAFGSDGMPMGPLLGIEAALRHPRAEERLSPRQAIWHYTYAAAWSLHWESRIGSLEADKEADLVVLETTDLSGPATAWGIARTYTGGVCRWTGSQERDLGPGAP